MADPQGEAAWRLRFRAPRIGLPRWARDAPERLVFRSNHTGKWELYAWDREAGTQRQLTDRREGTSTCAIAPAGDAIWWFDDTAGDEFGRWMIQPFDGSEAREAAPELGRAYNAGLNVGRSVAVIGRSTEAGCSIHVLRDGSASEIYRHSEDAMLGGLSHDGQLLCFVHSEAGDSRHPDLRVVELDGSVVADLSDGPGLELSSNGWPAVPGDERLLVMHERHDLSRPLIWWPRTGATRELEIDLPGNVNAHWYPDGQAILLVHERAARFELFRFDLESGDMARVPTERGTISAAEVRPDGSVWYLWSNAATPPQVRSTTGGVVLEPPGERAPTGVRYTDLKVGDVPAFVAEPASRRPHPTIFQVHGGPELHDRDSYSPAVQAWVDHGLAVVLVNYRGSTGYGRAWRDGLTGNPGLTELADIAAVFDRVVSDGIADPERVVLSGASWGGYLTLLGLGVQPERWALGVAGVPVADYIAAYEDETEQARSYDRDLFGATPTENPQLYRERSPITFIERVRVPVMILAGENDPRCPIRQIDNYLRRLDALGKPHEVLRYDAGHRSLRTDAQIGQMAAEIDFVARHLGTTPPQ